MSQTAKKIGMAWLILIPVFSVFGGEMQYIVPEERPLWLWGAPSWGGGNYPEDTLSRANEWAEQKFGATFRISCIPKGMDHGEGLNLLLAEGMLPDYINLGSYNKSSQKMFIDLARFGKISPLDKYFYDQNNYPHLERVGRNREFIKAYIYKRAIYALPGMNTRLDQDESAWNFGLSWVIRLDIAKLYGSPENTGELLNLLRKVKHDGYRDLDNQPLIPFGMFAKGNNWDEVIRQLKGAGWEVDNDGRLIPNWATKETYDAVKYLNLLWRERLMHPQLFELNTDMQLRYSFSGKFAVFAGPSWWIKGPIETLRKVMLVHGGDSREAVRIRDRIHVMLVPPVREADGRTGKVINEPADIGVVAAECPNPDALMTLFDFLLSDEGTISVVFDAGIQGVDWYWASHPPAWELAASPDSNFPLSDEKRAGAWRTVEEAAQTPPKILPMVHFFCSRTNAATEYRLWPQRVNSLYRESLDVPLGDNGFTVKDTAPSYTNKVQRDIVSPNPSYDFVIFNLQPLEALACLNAEEIWNQNLPHLIGSTSAQEFDDDYRKLLAELFKLADWKHIYNKKQKNWLDWIVFNGIDDRKLLRRVTPRSEWLLIHQ